MIRTVCKRSERDRENYKIRIISQKISARRLHLKKAALLSVRLLIQIESRVVQVTDVVFKAEYIADVNVKLDV